MENTYQLRIKRTVCAAVILCIQIALQNNVNPHTHINRWTFAHINRGTQQEFMFRVGALNVFSFLFIHERACYITSVNLSGNIVDACSMECTVHLPTINFWLLVGPTTWHWVSWRRELARPCMGACRHTRNRLQTALQYNSMAGKHKLENIVNISLGNYASKMVNQMCTLHRHLSRHIQTLLDRCCSVLDEMAHTVLDII